MSPEEWEREAAREEFFEAIFDAGVAVLRVVGAILAIPMILLALYVKSNRFG